MAIIKNKYKDRTDQQIKTFPNGTIPSDFTRKIVYDNETLVNPTIIRTPKYGDDLDTTEFSKVIADLVYNDSVLNEESEKHNYIYSNGVIKNYQKEFKVYEKNLLQVLALYDVNTVIDTDTFSLKTGNSIAGNFTGNNYCNIYFYTNSQRLLNLYNNFFYKEFNILNIITQDNNTISNFKDDYSVIIFNGEIPFTNASLQDDEIVGIVLYLPITTRNSTPYKARNFINYIKVGNGALKIGDTFVDIKKDTYVSRATNSDINLNQIKIPNILETNFKSSFRTRRDILLAYYDQNTITNNIIFDGIIDLIIGDERINTYSPVDTQILTTPRIKKIEYITSGLGNFHRIHLDDLCLLKGMNTNGEEIFFRKANQTFIIRNSIDNIFDGEYIIKAINYENRTIDFVHPTFNNSSYYQPQETENIIGYYGHLVPNIYVLYSMLIHKDDGLGSETQIMRADQVFDYIGLESGVTRVEKTVLEINSSGMFEVSKNEMKHLKNFNGNLLEYDDAQSIDVPSEKATDFTLTSKTNGDYILRPAEQQLPNEYDEIGLNSLSNSHFIITEDNFSVINNSKISLSEIYLGVKNSLSSIGTEGIKIKIEEMTMLYALDDPRKIDNIEPISLGNEFRITLATPDSNIEVDDIIFIANNQYTVGNQIINGNGDYQMVKIKRIENEKIIIDKITSTYSAEFKRNVRYPIFFNIIKKDGNTKICESLLTNDEIRKQIINGLNGKFGDKNSYSKLKFDRFIENIDPGNNLLVNGISPSQAQDFKLDINKYYFISVAGFVINNIAGTYSSILIEDHNLVDDVHFKKSIYYEINIKSFKGRYPNSLIVSDDFGDINVFDITRTFAPFFRVPKYSIMAYDFSNLDVSLNDVPQLETVVLFDPLTGRFKFHPNVTPSRIYLSYYTIENLSGASESENFIYKRGEDSNDTLRGKIQELDNKYVYGANFNSPIVINGVSVDNTLNYKGPFRIKNNKIELKTTSNFVDLDIDKFEIEIDKNSSYEIIDIEKNSLYLKNNIVERDNEVQSINRNFLDYLHDQTDKNHYEPPVLNINEELVYNVSEDTTIDQSLINTKKWQSRSKQENGITIPFLANKKFNKINFSNFNKNLIIDCLERTKTENLISEETNLNYVLEEFVYRKLKEKNYKYALNQDYTEDTALSFRENDETKQLNKTLIKDSEFFNKSEMVNVFIESENNILMNRESFVYNDLNINKTNSNNYIIINDHVISFDINKINKKYPSITFSNSTLLYNSALPTSGIILEGTVYFFRTSGYSAIFEREILIGDFIVKNENDNEDVTDWDFYQKNDIFNISKLTKGDDLEYSLSDFNEINIDYNISNFNNSLQNKLVNNVLIRNDIVKINDEQFLIFLLIKDTNDVYSLYLQKFILNMDGFFFPEMINGDFDYLKIATSQNTVDYLKINKNNLYYNFLVLNENTFLLCIMSDSFLFKYFHLDDLTIDEGVTFINDQQIKNNPELIKLNDQVFGIFFNAENTLSYDSSLGDLEIKIYEIETKNNIIFSYQETNLSNARVDKIIIDNIKNSSNFNYLKMSDDTIIVFYSNINSFYLNNIALVNGEYITDYPSGLLNCFKVINFKKTDEDYQFEISNKKMVYYQNIGQTAFPPKIYPFKINSNIFGVNYIQYNLNNIETGNRLYTYNIDGVLQKVVFENDEYSEENPNSIKYIYSLNNRQAIEFSSSDVKIHNFNNNYNELVLKEDIDYKTYFSSYNYATIFNFKNSNPFEIKTIVDKDGKVFDKKILTYFTLESGQYKLNVGIINDLRIDFAAISKFDVTYGPISLLLNNNKIVYQSDVIYYENKIFLIYAFMAFDEDSSTNKILLSLVEIGAKLANPNSNFEFINNIAFINNIKGEEDDANNKFFFSKIANDKIEINSIRELTIDSDDKNIISKHTLQLISSTGTCQFLETRLDESGEVNLTNSEIDLIYSVADLDIINIYAVNKNDKLKYVLESYTFVNNIDGYDYFYIQNDLQIFSLFSLTINPFNVNCVNYSSTSNELLLFGDLSSNIVNYVFNFNTNLVSNETMDNFNTNKYKFLKINALESDTFIYYKIINQILYLKIYLKKAEENISLVYENSYTYSFNIDDIAFNNYKNIYDTFVYLGNAFIRNIWNFFPMNSINSNEMLLENEILNNKVSVGETYKKVFSGLSISGTLSYDSLINKNVITIFDENLIKIINNNNLNTKIFYINNNSNLCVFQIIQKINESDYYEIQYLVGENTKSTLLNKRLDYFLYQNETYSFYKKSYHSLSLKLEMFNYKGIKKNQYEIYRKNNYYYEQNKAYDYNTLYKSDVFLVKGEYKDFQIIYHIDDEYEKTRIYAKNYLIISNSLYSFNNKTQILIDEYIDNDNLTFICEKLSNSNIFFSFKKNNDYVYNYIINKNYGFEELDPDFTKRELYKFISINDKVLVDEELVTVNVLEEIADYNITPLAAKKLFNNYLLFLLKIEKDNIIKIAHVLYDENGVAVKYYNDNYNLLYKLNNSDDITGYSKVSINTYGYSNMFIYKNDFSRDILQFGIDGEGGICKLKGITNLF
jgi:hypothetical protein